MKKIRRTKQKRLLAFALSLLLIVPALCSFPLRGNAAEIGKEEVAKNAAVWEDVTSLRTQLIDELTAESKIFNYIDRADFEKAGHVARLKEKEELYSYVFRNTDGSNTVYIMGENVKYIDEKGMVREKDLTLGKNAKGGYTVINEVQLSFPEKVTEGSSLVFKGNTVTLTPVQAVMSEKATALTASATAAAVAAEERRVMLSEGTEMSKGQVQYRKVFGNTASLKYTATLSGMNEEIVLDAYRGMNSFRFTLETGALSVYETNGNYYISSSKNSSERISIGNTVAYDHAGTYSLGDLKVEKEDAGRYVLTMKVDEAFLENPETVYPVSVSSSYSVAEYGDGITGSGSIEDAVLYQGLPNRNCGTMLFNDMGSSEYGTAKTVVRLPGLYNSEFYNSVTSTQLRSVKFYVKEASGNATQTISLHAVNNPWTESTVTWNNLGDYSDTAYDSVQLSNSAWKAFDITSLAQCWKEEAMTDYNAEAGFVLISQNNSAKKQFYSSEYSKTSYKPYVTVDYIGYVYIDGSSRMTMFSGGEGTQLHAGVHPSGLTVRWMSDNETVATVSDSGVVSPKSYGMANITAVAATPTGEEYVSAPVKIYVVDDLWKNGSTESASTFIQRANCAPGSNGGYLHPRYLDSTTENNTVLSRSIASDLPRWEVVYHHAGNYGYYTIKSLNTGKYIGVSTDAFDGEEVAYYSSNGTMSTRWAIKKVGTGRYKIVSMCSEEKELVLKGTGSGNSFKVVVSEYSADGDYMDEWTLFEQFDFILAEQSHASIQTPIELGFEKSERIINNMIEKNKRHILHCRWDLTVEQMIEYIKYSEIILIFTHGNSGGIQIDSARTFLSSSHIEQLGNQHFKDTKLVVLAACECGRGVVNGVPVNDSSSEGSFSDILYSKGAQAVVSFNFSINVSALKKWCRCFFDALLRDFGSDYLLPVPQILTIEDALDFAKEQVQCGGSWNVDGKTPPAGTLQEELYWKCYLFGSNFSPEDLGL